MENRKKIKVMKLGGAFFDSEIIKNFSIFEKKGKRLYVVSALKGITRILDVIFMISIQKDIDVDLIEDSIKNFLERFKQKHLILIDGLFKEEKEDILRDFSILFDELKNVIQNNRPKINAEKYLYDQYYSSILKFGELSSSKILYHYLLSIGVKNTYFDARDYVLTSSEYREAKIISIDPSFENLFEENQVLVTQGFIGKSITGKDTVIGFDGSDKSAAQFAVALSEKNEVELTFFKDVPGVYKGNPKKESNLELFISMTISGYLLLVEETGSFVVRPDSISCLANKNILIKICSYLDLEAPGTVIKD